MGEAVMVLEEALHFVALRHLDLIAPERVVAWASEAVGHGSESPALLTLACQYPGAETEVIDASLLAYLGEVGAHVPDTVECVLLLSGEVAMRILSGDLGPAAGGKRIVRLSHYADDEPRLFSMRSAVDDWENVWPESLALLDDIREAAAPLAELRAEVLRSLMSEVDGRAGAAAPGVDDAPPRRA